MAVAKFRSSETSRAILGVVHHGRVASTLLFRMWSWCAFYCSLQSLATGRLATFYLPFVDYELPNDPEPTIDDDGSVLPSCE